MNVPFLNLKAQYDTIGREVDQSIREVLSSCSFSGGPFVERFEAEFAHYCGCCCAVGVGSGTEALWLALLGLGVTAGDEVITAPNSFIATAEAISLCGAAPVFVDVDEDSYTMDPTSVEAAITSRTKAIIPVHLFGQMADMDPILDIANRHGIAVVEDACQAHGATYKGRRAGSLGVAGCFSFYPGKNLGAYGEAGCVVTSSPELAEQIRMRRDHGQARKYYHRMIGINGRMDGMQGAVLSTKLKYLDAWNEARRTHAAEYDRLLAGISPLTTPVEMSYGRHVYHIYAVRVPKRVLVMSALAAKGISCGVHYPVPIHLQDAYLSRGEKGRYPVTERCAEELLSLPMFPELTGEQIGYVAEQLKELTAEG
ncbi:DegT/DnrJ/EryC1/StrS family aminotransferase [Geomonas sp. Red32]|uniref:DegT/DnrJ/EryC1/StrS family aminotransferase n=1 Tax=Geomonas sp. Red32 TaxID=2912856 RepID=UPI00202D0D80|nr:DegT/DnrJ/EryC1/StrS family aminotransferase [Geomonas sp. Red32]MCM0082868.1 DegT/DnrJ/EryC1/StrS family aminotransferase [Geomonas sp. Red32]